MKTALIAGSTGLIGGQLLELLLASTEYSKVVAITRKALPAHLKLVQVKMDLDKIPELNEAFRADDVFCCLGTTISKAGSKEKFRQVDFEYPLMLAQSSLAFGATQYLIVTALGAAKDSAIFYNRVKGEVEEAISAVGFQTVHIFRPSLLIGPRTEARTGEEAAKVFYKIFGFAIPKKYKAIESLKVAKAMLHFASQQEKGKFIHESVELQSF
jgi:uncharacterized protein YbjT (DUF2867 family)